MALQLSDLETVLAEIQPILAGGWIQKIHQPEALTITIEVRSPGASVVLYICAEPRFARFHFTSRKYSNPPAPSPFCQFLRSHLEGGRIEEVTQQPGDRIVYVKMRKSEKAYILAIALLGNRANVFLLNENQVLLRSLQETRLQIGERFVPPKKKSSPVSPASLSLKDRDIRKPPQREGKFIEKYPVSAMLETFYEEKEKEQNQKLLHEQQLTQGRKALRAARAKLQALQEDFKKAERYCEYARYGELMKSALHTMHKGQETATLTDYFDPALPTLTLPLDPAKDPVRNMEDYFRKYQKYLGAQEHLVPRIEMQQQKFATLEGQLIQIERGIIDPVFSPKTPKKSQLPPTPRSPKVRPVPAQGYRTYTSADGISILVGKTAKDNDHLTFKVGKPNDLWLHARGTPGSHVIVRLGKGQVVPHETLRDAATLTLWFSDLRKSGKGDVIYTLQKFVKKTKGQKSGTVTVTRDKSMWIDLKDERLERLKAANASASAPTFQAPTNNRS